MSDTRPLPYPEPPCPPTEVEIEHTLAAVFEMWPDLLDVMREGGDITARFRDGWLVDWDVKKVSRRKAKARPS